MNCDDIQILISAYVDNELDLSKCIEVEKHLNECQSCSAVLRDCINLRSALKNKELYYSAPESLTDKLSSSLRISKKPVIWYRKKLFAWNNIALAFSVALIFVLGTLIINNNNTRTSNLDEFILNNHLRSLQYNHLTDVESTDQHTVKPWFDGKLDFSPPVVDLKEDGFPLYGGRIDFIENRPAAVLVYNYKKHIINVFIALEGGHPVPSGISELQGYNIINWNNSGMNFWIISDASLDELKIFSHLFKSAIH